MIQEQITKRKRYTYTHTHVYIVAKYVHTYHHGGGWGGRGTSDIEKQGRSKSYGLQKVMVVAKYM